MDPSTSSNIPIDNSSNYQGIIIIILVILGIILFIYLLIEFVTAPGPVIAPFADGSIIKIKSLGNNKYLRPVSCSNLRCTTGPPREICGEDSRYDAILADAIESDIGTEWILCQYKGTLPTGTTEAAYMVYNGNTVDNTTSNMIWVGGPEVGSPFRYLARDNDVSFCPNLASRQIDNQGICQTAPDGKTFLIRYYLNFILIDAATNQNQSGSFNQNGTYEIRFIDPTDFGITNGCGEGLRPLYLYNSNEASTTCGNIIDVIDINAPTPNRNDIREKLNYGFFIQVVK